MSPAIRHRSRIDKCQTVPPKHNFCRQDVRQALPAVVGVILAVVLVVGVVKLAAEFGVRGSIDLHAKGDSHIASIARRSCSKIRLCSDKLTYC